MADEDIYRLTGEVGAMKPTIPEEHGTMTPEPSLEAGLVVMETMTEDAAGDTSSEVKDQGQGKVAESGQKPDQEEEEEETEGAEAEGQEEFSISSLRAAGGGVARRHLTVLDPRQSVPLSHCEDAGCPCGGKVHCPFCNMQHYKPSRPARVRDHLTLLHFLHAVQFQDMLVVKCFHDCQHPAGHYHCPVCPSQILKRVAFAHHLRSHLNKQGKSIKEVRTPDHKQVDRILFDGVEILLCREPCSDTLGKHYHCPFCKRVSFSELGPMMSHVWRCRDGQVAERGEGPRTRVNQTWTSLTQAEPDLPPPQQAFPDHWHKSVVRGVKDLEAPRCQLPDCCGRKFHCPLCMAGKFKPTFLRHLRAHILAHWRNRVQFKDYSILVCYDNCEVRSDASLPVRFHFHCPQCGVTRRRKQAMLNHFQVCGSQAENTAANGSEALGTEEGSNGSDDNFGDDIGWPDDGNSDGEAETEMPGAETDATGSGAVQQSRTAPVQSPSLRAHAGNNGSSVERNAEMRVSSLTPEDIRNLEVFQPVTAALSPAMVAAMLAVVPSVQEFCRDVCGSKVALTSSPGTLEPVFALTGTLSALSAAQTALHRKLYQAVSGFPSDDTDTAAMPRRRGRPPKPRQPLEPAPVKRKVGRPRLPPREDPDFSPLKPIEAAPSASDTGPRRYGTRGIKRDYSALESGRLLSSPQGELRLASDSASSASVVESPPGPLSSPLLPRKRGRPRKTPLVSPAAGEGDTGMDKAGSSSSATQTPIVSPPRRRGRPRKIPQPPEASTSSSTNNTTEESPGVTHPNGGDGNDDGFAMETDAASQNVSEEGLDSAVLDTSGEESLDGEDLPESRAISLTSNSDLSTAVFPTVRIVATSKLGRFSVPQGTLDKTTERGPSLTENTSTSTGTPLHQCPGCSETSPSFEEMQQHIAAQHPELQGLCCSVCELVLPATTGLDLHLKSRHGPRPQTSQFTCSVCGKVCLSLAALRWHQTYNHGRTLVCQTCQHESATPLEHQMHKRQHRRQPPQCPVCNKMLGTLANLRIHVQAQHSHHKHHCPVPGCGKVFRHVRYLSAHMRRHRASKTHTCPTCSRSFACANTLNEHMETHKDVKDRRYRFICPYCAAQYRNKSNFQDHLNKHTGEKPHKCPQCDKTFGFRSQLVKHKIFIHNSERPFQCPQCPRAFKFQRLLNQHTVVHTQVSPHTCHQCHKPYSCAATLKAHYSRCRGDRSLQAAVQQAPAPATEKTVVIEMQDGGEGIVNISGLEMLQEAAPSLEDAGGLGSQVYLCGICRQMFAELNAAGEHIATAHTTDASSEIELKLETAEGLAPALPDFQTDDPFPPPHDAAVDQPFLPAMPLLQPSHDASGEQ